MCGGDTLACYVATHPPPPPPPPPAHPHPPARWWAAFSDLHCLFATLTAAHCLHTQPGPSFTHYPTPCGAHHLHTRTRTPHYSPHHYAYERGRALAAAPVGISRGAENSTQPGPFATTFMDRMPASPWAGYWNLVSSLAHCLPAAPARTTCDARTGHCCWWATPPPRGRRVFFDWRLMPTFCPYLCCRLWCSCAAPCGVHCHLPPAAEW